MAGMKIMNDLAESTKALKKHKYAIKNTWLEIMESAKEGNYL